MNSASATLPRWELVCERLSVRRGRSLVLHNVNLTIGANEAVAVIGPNGSGKTTLMLALLGLLPAAEGTVCVNGRDVHRLSPGERGRFAAYVPQLLEGVPGFSVRDVVAGGRYPHVSPLRPLRHADELAIAAALDRCGLRHLESRPLNQISGGERQKTLIAAALAQDAHYMLLDEPNTALDPSHQIDLLRLLRDWHEAGRSLVLISHDLQFPAVLARRVIALREGRVVADAPTEQVLEPEALSAIYHSEFAVVLTREGRRLIVPQWWN